MIPRPFELERYFAEHEFSAKYLLSSSDCDGFPLTYVLEQATPEERNLWETLTLGYTESQGHPLLREAILKQYATDDVHQVVVASPGELNYVAMRVLLQPEDHVISVAPAYQSLYEIVRSVGCELSHWRPDPANWQFDPAELEALVQPNTKLLIINFPHNPTGAYLSKAELDQVIAFARAHDLYLFSDEMYHQLVVGETEVLPPVADLYEKGISLWGTSKTFGLAGLRIGWLVSQDQTLLEQVIAFKDYLSICSSAPSEILSLIAMNHPEAFRNPNLRKIQGNIVRFQAFADRSELVAEFIPPRAGSTAFVKLNLTGPSKSFSDRLVAETGLMTLPGEMFEYPGPYIRVGFGRENFAESLAVLEKYENRISQ